MTKKCYACIKCSTEISAEIQKLTNEVLAKGGMTKAYGSIKKIAELNDKFVKEFKDVDPNWTPPVYNQKPAPQPTMKAPAIAYEEQIYQ